MENFGYDVFIAIISAIFGALFGVLIPKLLKSEEKICNYDKQLIFTQIHLEQNQYIYNISSHNTKPNRQSNGTQNVSGVEMLIVYLLGALVLIYGFLKFESKISMIIIMSTVLLESTFLTTICVLSKKYYMDMTMKAMLLFNILATAVLPILVYIMKNPLYGRFVNKTEILNRIDAEGILSLLSDVNVLGFLLYQAIGVIFLFAFILYTLIGTLHVLSMINLTLRNRLTKLWRFIYTKTISFCMSVGSYIVLGLLLLVVSFLFVSGVLSALITGL